METIHGFILRYDQQKSTNKDNKMAVLFDGQTLCQTILFISQNGTSLKDSFFLPIKQ
jgi:hypothetical protein